MINRRDLLAGATAIAGTVLFQLPAEAAILPEAAFGDPALHRLGYVRRKYDYLSRFALKAWHAQDFSEWQAGDPPSFRWHLSTALAEAWRLDDQEMRQAFFNLSDITEWGTCPPEWAQRFFAAHSRAILASVGRGEGGIQGRRASIAKAAAIMDAYLQAIEDDYREKMRLGLAS